MEESCRSYVWWGGGRRDQEERGVFTYISHDDDVFNWIETSTKISIQAGSSPINEVSFWTRKKIPSKHNRFNLMGCNIERSLFRANFSGRSHYVLAPLINVEKEGPVLSFSSPPSPPYHADPQIKERGGGRDSINRILAVLCCFFERAVLLNVL